VDRIADPLRVIAASRDGIVEGMELKPEAERMLPFLLAVQFHPERLARRHPEHRAVFRAFTLACMQHSEK
jgi:putative glutamine amidotransferase